jgi:hypothetical protein
MWEWIKERFASKKPRTLDDISEEELLREKVRLEQQQKKYIREIDDLEEQKTQLFNEGQEAAGSVHRQRSIAQRIVAIDRQVKLTDRKLRAISKQLQAVSNFSYLKQSKRELENSGLFGIINEMDLEELDRWIEQASVDGELNMTKLEDMLQRVSAGMDLADDIEDEPEVAAIMEMFQQGGSISDLDSVLAEKDDELEATMTSF